MTVRMPFLDKKDLPEKMRLKLAELPPLNVFKALTNTPASFEAFSMMGHSLLIESKFDPKKREIAILRVAHLTKASYEWHHHVAKGKQTGLTDDEIENIAVDGPVTDLDEEGNLLCRVAEEITKDVRLSDETLSSILDRYGRLEAAELILCCSYYNMVSRFLESNRVEIENDVHTP